jgi:hypothetical protein
MRGLLLTELWAGFIQAKRKRRAPSGGRARLLNVNGVVTTVDGLG